MRKRIILLLTVIIAIAACKQKIREYPGFVFVKGGTFVNTTSNLYGKQAMIPDFYIGLYEVTQKEWTAIMGSNPSAFKGDELPVESASWYECVEYCNKRSTNEGLTPYYQVNKLQKDPANKSEFDTLKYIVNINPTANGYRMPTEAEWEYAAGGGQKSKSFIYSGSNQVEEVAWYWMNSGERPLKGSWVWSLLEKNKCKTHPVGTKKPNELGIFDMSGNVREWCEDWYQDQEIKAGMLRSQRGGGWIGADYRCKTANRHSFEASGKGPDQGLRVCRSR